MEDISPGDQSSDELKQLCRSPNGDSWLLAAIPRRGAANSFEEVRTGLCPGGRWIPTIGTPPNFFGRPSIPAQFTFRNINRLPRDRDRWFESISLQRRVHCAASLVAISSRGREGCSARVPRSPVVGAERNFGLVDLDHALQRLALGIDHRSSQLLRQQPGSLVCDAELGLELECRHAVRVGCHQMRGPEPHGQRQLGPVHHRASCDRRLTTAAEAFVGVRPALQQCRASVANKRGKQNPPASIAQTETPRSSSRLENSPGIRSEIVPLPLGALLAPAASGWPRGYYTSYGGSLKQRDKPSRAEVHFLDLSYRNML